MQRTIAQQQTIRTIAIKVGDKWQPRIQYVNPRDLALNRFSEDKPEYKDIWTQRKLYVSRDEAEAVAQSVLAIAFNVVQ